MENNARTELMRELGPSPFTPIAATVCLSPALLLPFITAAAGKTSPEVFLPVLFAIIMLVWAWGRFEQARKACAESIDAPAEICGIDALYADFRQAESFLKGKLRLGRTHLFSRSGSVVLRYSQMTGIRHLEGHDSPNEYRWLDVRGNSHVLYVISRSGDYAEMERVLTVIRQKQPGIQIID